MAEYLAFAKDHFFLFAAAAALIVIIAFSEFRRARRPWHDADSAVAVRLINAGAQVLDLRGHDAFRAGHIVGARHVPMDELETKAGKLDKSQPVIVYCDTGVTSARAAAMLVREGFADVWQLHGGLAAWKRDNMPVAKA